MNGLDTALREAAVSAQPSPGAPPEELWQRGRQRVRRRRLAGAGAAAAVIAVVGIIGTSLPGLQTSTELPPVTTANQLRLPNTFYGPSNWLPSTDDKGEIGPLAAVVTGYRDGLFEGGHDGVAGVSATGAYRFLDAPGLRSGDTAFALSPDGRRLAYWVFERQHGSTAIYNDLAVYDTVTGEVQRKGLTSEHGLSAGGLLWVSGEELLFQSQAFEEPPARDGFSSLGGKAQSWNLRTGVLDVVDTTELSGVSVGPERVIVSSAGKVITLQAPGGRKRVVRTTTAVMPEYSGDSGHAHLSADSGRLALVQGPECPCPVAIVPVQTGKAVAPTAVLDAKAYELLGWRDDQHVVVLRKGGWFSVDVTSGDVERLAGFSGGIGAGNVHVARDAWTAPSFDAPEPPTPMDPSLKIGLGVAGVLMIPVLFRWWRRRVRP